MPKCALNRQGQMIHTCRAPKCVCFLQKTASQMQYVRSCKEFCIEKATPRVAEARSQPSSMHAASIHMCMRICIQAGHPILFMLERNTPAQGCPFWRTKVSLSHTSNCSFKWEPVGPPRLLQRKSDQAAANDPHPTEWLRLVSRVLPRGDAFLRVGEVLPALLVHVRPVPALNETQKSLGCWFLGLELFGLGFGVWGLGFGGLRLEFRGGFVWSEVRAVLRTRVTATICTSSCIVPLILTSMSYYVAICADG